MNRELTAAIFGASASSADTQARRAARHAAKADAAYSRRREARNSQLAALYAQTTTWLLRDLFAARKQQQ